VTTPDLLTEPSASWLSEAVRERANDGSLSLWERVRVRAFREQTCHFLAEVYDGPHPLPLSQRARGAPDSLSAAAGLVCFVRGPSAPKPPPGRPGLLGADGDTKPDRPDSHPSARFSSLTKRYSACFDEVYWALLRAKPGKDTIYISRRARGNAMIGEGVFRCKILCGAASHNSANLAVAEMAPPDKGSSVATSRRPLSRLESMGVPLGTAAGCRWVYRSG
jgi:hypothetical protein